LVLAPWCSFQWFDPTGGPKRTALGYQTDAHVQWQTVHALSLTGSNPHKLMQSIYFAIGHFLEATFVGLAAMGWLPSIAISVVLGVGFLYWMNLQGKYSAKAKRDGTLI